jgi:pectinesterase
MSTSPGRCFRTALLIGAAVMASAAGLVGMPSASAHRAAPETIRAVRYGPEAHQLLDLYLPVRTGRNRVPTIVYLHSGGWIAGSRANVADLAAAEVVRGYAVASVDYQLAIPGVAGSFPAAVYDVKRAVRFVKADAANWGLDPSRVILMGSSAGGHLAALSAASAGKL